MTYFQFHLVFLFPVLLFFVWLNRRDLKSKDFIGGLVFLSLIAFVYTTPWDNYLVKTEVWGYPAGRVLGVIGYVPIEEYMFFVLQSLATGLWLWWLYRSQGLRLSDDQVSRRGGATILGLGVYLILFLVGIWSLSFEEGTYLALILVWAMPVGVLQWGIGGHIIAKRLGLFMLAVGAPTLYLILCDMYAVADGIWYISESQTLGVKLFHLPIEEAVFFLVTNLMVVQGLTLFWYFIPKWKSNQGVGLLRVLQQG